MRIFLIFFVLFSPVTLANIGGEWEFAGYFCRSSTGQFQKIPIEKLDVDITLSLNAEDNIYNFKSIWTYGSIWDHLFGDEYNCELNATGTYTINDLTLELGISTVDMKFSSGGFSCPPSNLGIGGRELQFEFLEIRNLMYVSTGLKCDFKGESTEDTTQEEGDIYQALKRPEPYFDAMTAIP